MEREKERDAAMEAERLAREIQERAQTTSQKVKERAEIWIARLTPKTISREHLTASERLEMLGETEAELRELTQNPDDILWESYKDWTAEEIKELYRVLHGKEMV